MACDLLHHRHKPRECGVVFAAWATRFASFAMPAGTVDTVLNLAVNVVVTILTFALVEEVACRVHLLPRLLQLGRSNALAITGLVHAAWGALAALTVTSSPVLVNEYLAGDTGVFILLTTIVAAFWLRRLLRQHPGKES